MDWCGECVNERPPARTPSNSHRVPVWPAWDTAYGRSRCAKKELFFSLSSLSFQASAVANKEIDVPSFFLMNDFNSDLHRRGVNIPYVKSVKIRALAEWDNQFFFLLRLVNFHGSLSGPKSRQCRHWEVEYSWPWIYNNSRISTIWSRNFSDVWGVFDVLLSKSAFHRKVGQCSTSTIGTTIRGKDGN